MEHLALRVVLAATLLVGAVPPLQAAVQDGEQRSDEAARVSVRIADHDPQEAAWGAFEARTLHLTECAPALVARLRATEVAADRGPTPLQLGLIDALVALDVELEPRDAPALHARVQLPTLLLIARNPEGHAPFLRELVERTAAFAKPSTEWLAPRLMLVEERDPGFAAMLLRSRTPELRVRLVDPPEPGPRVLRCGGVSMGRITHDRSDAAFVPEEYPPTARWHARGRSEPGSLVLAHTASRSLYLHRTVMIPGQGGGAGGGGTLPSTDEHERDMLLDLSVGPDRVSRALDGFARRFEWTTRDELVERITEWESEFEEARATLVRRVAKHTKLDPEAFRDALAPRRVLVDDRERTASPLVPPAGWRLDDEHDHDR